MTMIKVLNNHHHHHKAFRNKSHTSHLTSHRAATRASPQSLTPLPAHHTLLLPISVASASSRAAAAASAAAGAWACTHTASAPACFRTGTGQAHDMRRTCVGHTCMGRTCVRHTPSAHHRGVHYITSPNKCLMIIILFLKAIHPSAAVSLTLAGGPAGIHAGQLGSRV